MLGFELRVLHLLGHVLYHLSHDPDTFALSYLGLMALHGAEIRSQYYLCLLHSWTFRYVPSSSIVEMGLTKFLPWLVSNHYPLDLYFPSRWDYSGENHYSWADVFIVTETVYFFRFKILSNNHHLLPTHAHHS